MNRFCHNLLSLWFICCLYTTSVIYSDEAETHDTKFPQGAPWFTGPLLSPSAATVKPGYVNIYPFFNINTLYGRYNKHWKIDSVPTLHQTVLIVPVKTGVTNWLDFAIFPRVLSNWREGSQDFNVGDIPIQLGIQLFRNSSNWMLPDIKLTLAVIAPTGKYERLNPKKHRTDVTGNGSWSPEAALSVAKFWQIHDFQYVSARWGVRYRVGTPVHVEGLNSYGGTSTTKGYVYPGNKVSLFGACEYNFTRNWVVACDAIYTHRNRTRFVGIVGSNVTSITNMKPPSGEIFSLAPALEYNWNLDMGIIFGAWFSLKGKNFPAFANAMISFNLFL